MSAAEAPLFFPAMGNVYQALAPWAEALLRIPDAATADPFFTHLDMWGEWVGFGRGEKYSFAALTHKRDREIGCTYLYPPKDGDDPYEAGLHMWTIEEALRDDSDLAILEEFLSWIEAEWDFNSIVYYTPEAYERGHEVVDDLVLSNDSPADLIDQRAARGGELIEQLDVAVVFLFPGGCGHWLRS